MEQLYIKYRGLLARTSTQFIRGAYYKIGWESRALAILGARGVGKSTLMVQYAKTKLPIDKTLYITLDDLYFTENQLPEVIDQFYLVGGRHLLVDEVHKYAGWERAIKNALDFYPDLNVVISGSSVLALQQAQVDLSRRVAQYRLNELSFREYLALHHNISVPEFSFADILDKHSQITQELVVNVASPIQHFREYLQFGAYPFYLEGKTDYYTRLNQVISLIIDYDLPEVRAVEASTLHKIKRLLFVLSRSVPFKPNIQKLSEQLETSRNKILDYLHILEEAGLVNTLRAATSGVSLLNKPEKIYLRNTNLIYALAESLPEKGNLRETVLLNWLRNAGLLVSYAEKGDFLVNDSITIEVGGREKGYKQINEVPKAYIASDDLEHGHQKKVPLWLFGMMY